MGPEVLENLKELVDFSERPGVEAAAAAGEHFIEAVRQDQTGHMWEGVARRLRE